MSGFAPMYGRQGPDAGGDPQVAELLRRTIDGQFKTTETLVATIRNIQANGKTPWTMPVPTMAITHAQWLAAMLWQAATSYLDNVVLTYDAVGELPREVYKECDSLCDLAGSMTMRAIEVQSQLDQGSKPLNASLVSRPDLRLNGTGYTGAWGVFEAIYLQVVSDFRLIERLGISKSMSDVYQSAKSALQPKADVFAYLQSSWASTLSEDNRKQLIRDALPVISELFAIGQQLWAPYLLGQVYVTALRYKPTLDDLELGFDPWCLTDPTKRKQLSADKTQQEELTAFWENVADPAAAYQLSEQIRAAHLSRRLRYRTGRGYNILPWPAQYLVRIPLQLGNRHFGAGDLIALYPSQNDEGKTIVEVRKSGRATGILDMLGQNKPST
jgi:hypothetical protein